MEREIAIEVLSKDFLLNVDMLEIIRRGSGEIIFASANGVLIKDKISGIYMMSAKGMETAEIIISKIPDTMVMIVGHEYTYHHLLTERFNFKDEMVCHNVVYTKKQPLKIPECRAEIRLLTEEYTKQVVESYSSLDLSDEDYIKDRINSKTMFGAFVNDKLCGFIGSHEEGSIGILEVLPEYRGLGIGAVLQATATNDALKNNRYAYGQVKEGNVASINLQKKLGFHISKEKVYWLFR